MKSLFYLLFFTLIGHFASAQEFKTELVDSISDEVCACLDDKERAENPEETVKTLKSCMLEVVFKNLNYLKENGVDVNDGSDDGRQFGELVGVKLASMCESALPAFVALGTEAMENKENTAVEVEYEELPFIIGKITEIENGTFPVFKITDTDGGKHNVLWLTIIDNPALFEEALKGKKNFILEYYDLEMYDHRIKEYRYMKVLNAVKTE
jgi:hypothetical protein